jgi:hypothetical protein
VEDRLVWDLGDPTSNPHGVAVVMCRDLGLPSHAVPVTSVCIVLLHMIHIYGLCYSRRESRDLGLPSHAVLMTSGGNTDWFV